MTTHKPEDILMRRLAMLLADLSSAEIDTRRQPRLTTLSAETESLRTAFLTAQEQGMTDKTFFVMDHEDFVGALEARYKQLTGKEASFWTTA